MIPQVKIEFNNAKITFDTKKDEWKIKGQKKNESDVKLLLMELFPSAQGLDIKKMIDDFKVLSEETVLDEKASLDDRKRALYLKLLTDDVDSLPFRYSVEDGGNYLLHIIKNLDLRVVESVQFSNTVMELFDIFQKHPVLDQFLQRISCEFEKVLPMNFQAVECVENIRSIYIMGRMENICKLKIHDVKVFSKDKSEWKLSWIDEDRIDLADENDIGTWQLFGNNLVNSEKTFKQFAAWIWIMFDERASKRNRQCLWLYGDGYDGKSTIVDTIRHIIANDIDKTDGTGSIDGNNMNQFWAAPVVNKVLVCVNEVKDPHFLSSSYMHQWLGGDAVSIEMKNHTPYTKKLTARCMICSNVEPVINKSENNEITRIIPIRIGTSYFSYDKLNSDNIVVEDKTFEQKLFEERWNFLKFCKKMFQTEYNRNMDLVKFDRTSLDNQVLDSESDRIRQEISELINRNSEKLFYKSEDIQSFIKWYFGKNSSKTPPRGTVPFMAKMGYKETKMLIGDLQKKGFKLSIDEATLSDFNTDNKYGYGFKAHKMIGYGKKEEIVRHSPSETNRIEVTEFKPSAKKVSTAGIE